MRYRFLTTVLCMMAAMPAFAQEQKPTAILTTPRERLHEAGAFVQFHPADNGINMQGLQYTRWKNEHKGIRFILAHGSYNNSTSPITIIIPDTVMMRKTTTRINMGIIGTGLTKQYHVNKTLYMFAAVELKGGYGRGSVDTTIVKQFVEGPTSKEITGNLFRDQDVSMMYAGITPSIGFKFQRKRISAGIELLPLEISYTSRQYSKAPSTSMLDLDFGLLRQRLFINYRF